MRFDHIRLTNWKNFREIEVDLPDRAFLIGPNASGKSNFLDAFRFLRDVAAPGGGLQRACAERGGFSKIRCLSARDVTHVGIEVTLRDNDDTWVYELLFNRQSKSAPVIVVEEEKVWKNGQILLERPDIDDRTDPLRLTQTALEQIVANRAFRSVVEHFVAISYLHLVPQMVRDATGLLKDAPIPDMYGGHFLEKIANTPKNTQGARLRKIEQFLKIVVPQLENLKIETDQRGVPHLEVTYAHWRPRAGKQDENQLSDGTLRLIGLLWALQDGSGLLLMEEPELSLHKAIVTQLAPFIYKTLRSNKKAVRQVFMSTHSADLLSDPGIGAEEILIFIPDKNGTNIQLGYEIDAIRSLMEFGTPASEAALPHTEPESTVQQLRLFEA